jgi:hypothetical protein
VERIHFYIIKTIKLSIEFYRRTILALLQLVHDAKCPDEDNHEFPTIKPSEYLYKEFMSEREAALKIADVIRDAEGLTWTQIREELSVRLDKDWYSPGNMMDLSYLSHYTIHD